MISKEEFISECDKIIDPEDKKEYERKRKQRTVWLASLLSLEFVSGLINFIGLILWRMIAVGIVAIFAMKIIMCFTIVMVLCETKFLWKNCKERYTHNVVDILLRDYKYSYQHRDGLPSELLTQSGFCGQFLCCRREDLLELNIPKDNGEPSRVKLKISDMHAENEFFTVYSGMFGYVKFPFKFKCNISLNANWSVGKKITFEDIEFNNLFDVYSDNEIEAHVMLTPIIIQKLKSLRNRLHNLKITLHQKGELFIGSADEMFKLNNRSKPEGAVFEHFYDDMSDIMAIINEIKNNNKLFKM